VAVVPDRDPNPPESAWVECPRCCDWLRADLLPEDGSGEPVCPACAEAEAESEEAAVALTDDLGIGGGP